MVECSMDSCVFPDFQPLIFIFLLIISITLDNLKFASFKYILLLLDNMHSLE
jgi:hypothetical protein